MTPPPFTGSRRAARLVAVCAATLGAALIAEAVGRVVGADQPMPAVAGVTLGVFVAASIAVLLGSDRLANALVVLAGVASGLTGSLLVGATLHSPTRGI